jgi:hypothetical protein
LLGRVLQTLDLPGRPHAVSQTVTSLPGRKIMTTRLQRRTVLGGAIAGAALL